MRDDNYQQQQEQAEQQYLELADKPLSLHELSYAELQKKEAALIKTIFDSEE